MFGLEYSHDYVGLVSNELLTVLHSAPLVGPKDVYIDQQLDQMFGCYDWSKSFYRTQVIVYDEVLPAELLVLIHRWLRKKCADIENICLITTHHTGVSNWWQSWCQINHEKSFSIKEIFYTNRPLITKSMKFFYSNPTLLEKDKEFFLDQKKISNLFSYYGGSYNSRA